MSPLTTKDRICKILCPLIALLMVCISKIRCPWIWVLGSHVQHYSLRCYVLTLRFSSPRIAPLGSHYFTYLQVRSATRYLLNLERMFRFRMTLVGSKTRITLGILKELVLGGYSWWVVMFVLPIARCSVWVRESFHKKCTCMSNVALRIHFPKSNYVKRPKRNFSMCDGSFYVLIKYIALSSKNPKPKLYSDVSHHFPPLTVQDLYHFYFCLKSSTFCISAF